MSERRKSSTFLTKSIALLLVILLLSLPLVTAAQISSVTVRGSNNISSIAKESDALTFEATVLHADKPNLYDHIYVQQRLQLGTDEEPSLHTFSNCNEVEDGKTVCTVTIDVEGGESTKYNYQVSLYRTTYQERFEDTFDGSYYVDSQKPTFTVSSFTQQGDKVNVSVEIRDMISSTSFFSKCSGIGNLRATFDGQTRATQEVLDFPCDLNTSFLIPLSAVDDGALHQICVKVDDAVGQTASTCQTLLIDLVPPSIDELYISNSNHDKLNFVASSGTQAKVYAKVGGTFDSSTAVFTYDGAEIIASCGVSICTSAAFELAKATTANVVFTVSDDRGNVATKSITQQIQVDTTAPSVSGISSTIVDAGVVYSSTATNLTATITEAGSGFYLKKPVLQIAGESEVAHSCTVNGATWTCVWPSSFFSAADGNYTATVSGFDDANNAIGGATTKEIHVDTTAPILSIASLTGESDLTDDATLLIAGGIAIVNLSYVDASPITVYANFTSIGGAITFGRCVTSPCELVSSDLLPGGERGIVSLSATDVAGNNAVINTESVYVLTDASDSEGDYFTHSLSLSPKNIETSTSDFLNQRAYATISGKLNDGLEGEVRAINLLDCKNPAAPVNNSAFDRAASADGGVAYLLPFEQVDLGSPSEMGILFTFKATAIREETITFECDVAVSGISDGSYVSSEVETVKIQFGTYELAVGSLPEGYYGEVESALEDALEGSLNTIASFRKWFEWAEKICRLIGTMKTLIGVLSGLGVNLSILGVKATAFGGAAYGVIGTKTFCEAQATQFRTDSIITTLSTVCQFVTCEKTLYDLGGGNGIGSIFGGKKKSGEAFTEGGTTGPVTSAPPPVVEVVDSSKPLTNPREVGPGEPEPNLGGAYTNRDTAADKTRLAGLTPLQMFGSSASTKDNLVLSAINLCIPGVINNLDKQRQIKCRYALCLIDDVSAGTPKQACDAAQELAMCQYVYGQLLGLLPIDFLNAIVARVKGFFTSPMALLNGLLSMNCAPTCAGNYPTIAAVGRQCYYANLLYQLGTIYGLIQQISNIGDVFDTGGQDYCSVLEDKKDDFLDGGSGSGPSGSAERSATQYG